MENCGMVSFKIHLIHNESEEPEIRRFGLPSFDVTSYSQFATKITELFPSLASKEFKIYWTDEDGDKVAVSSDDELYIALTSMKSDVKKFHVKVDSKGAAQGSQDKKNRVLFISTHPGIICDGCDREVIGIRYKCMMCVGYDLCKDCEQAGVHSEHLLLKIPHPSCIDRGNLHKLFELVNRYIPVKVRQRRHDSHDGDHDSHKKKKRSDKRESGPDTGDEMEDGCHRKHSHKKSKKHSSCPYSQMMDFLNPIQFQPRHHWCDEGSKRTGEDSNHFAYLKSVGSTIQKLLDPLGVNAVVEVRSNDERKEEEKGKKKEEEKREAEKPKPEPASSSTSQKEVPFISPQLMAETVKQGMEEITKILANQSINNEKSSSNNNSRRNSPDNDGWVSFEELKKESEEPQPGSSGEKAPRPSAPQAEKKAEEASSQEYQTLYPSLSEENLSPEVREALEKMLSMGFTNEGNWLTYLLKAKNGNINQALEVLLTAHKNN